MDPNESEHIRSTRGDPSRRRPLGETDIDRINADLDKMEDDDVWVASLNFVDFVDFMLINHS